MCTAFLEEMGFEKHVARCQSYYRDKLDVFLKTMAAHFPPESGVRWTKPEGGLFLWVSVPEAIDTAELFFDAIEHKVAFVPGEQFYGENPEKNHMRINFSFVSKEDLTEAVKRLATCIRERTEQ
jgi:2-aminoadipate transaminase